MYKDKFDELKERIELIEEECKKIDISFLEEIVKIKGEQACHYDDEHAWRDYQFILNKVIFRISNCIEYINNIIKYIDMLPKSDGEIVIPAIAECDYLSYEFEDLLIAFFRLNEDTLINEICRYISSKKANMLRDNSLKRSDVNGLFWRINVLRNRAAHSTPGFYIEHNKNAARYQSISSKINIIRYNSKEEEGLKIECNLIDIENSEYIRNLIKEVIIENKYGEEYSKRNIIDLLFENTKPKGHGKKSPQVLYIDNLPRFDFYKNFISLLNQMLDYISGQIDVFKK